MKEVALEIVCGVLAVVIPIITRYVIKLITAKINQIEETTTNENAKVIIDEAEKAISAAVSYTSQTFVEALKRDNLFTKEKQKEALNTALNKTLTMMSENTVNFINNTYGDVNEWVITKIEEAVILEKKNK